MTHARSSSPHIASFHSLSRSAKLGAALVGMASMFAGCASSPSTPEEGVVHTASPEEVAATHSTTPVTASSALLYVNGMGCPLCVTSIDKQLERLPGVTNIDTDLGTGIVTVSFSGPDRPSPHQLSEATKDAGLTLAKIETR